MNEFDTKPLFTNFNNNENVFQEFESYLIKLNGLNEISNACESVEAYEAIVATQTIIKYNSLKQKCIEILLKHNTIEKYLTFIEYLCQIRKELDFKNCKSILDPVKQSVCYKTTTLNEKRIFNLIYIDTIFNYILLSRTVFKRQFTSVNENKSTYLKTYFTFIGDLEFMINLNSYFNKGIFILNLGIIGQKADETLDKWQELNAINVVLEYGRLFKEYYLDVYNIVSYIATDKDIEKIPEIDGIIDKYIEYTLKAINNPDGKTSSIGVDIDGTEKTYSLNFVFDEFGFTTPVTFFIRCLYRLSVNDAIKLKIFHWSNFKNCLKKYIFNGIEIEKESVLELFCQLAFNKEINKELKLDSEFMSYIFELNQKEFEYKKLGKTLKELLFILENKDTNQNKTNIDSSHVMISYNTASRQLCIKIKEELERLNYKVWIDVNEIHGSSLDSMAKAVEQASCVLMCVTEKYRQSVNCQAEAQYAFKLNKLIIPCIMQPGYNNVSGWLGIIIGDKIFIDFTKYQFEDAFNRLIKQIELNQTEKNIISTEFLNKIQEKTNDLAIRDKNDNKNPENWTNSQVEEWFINNNIKSLLNFLSPINGKDLVQLYEIKLNVPEFFFKSLTKHDSIEIREVMLFSKLLVELFKKT